jgi:hypothetical protein
MSEIHTEFLFTLHVEIGERHSVGITPYVHRGIAHVTGGRFEGPGLAGSVLQGSGDWTLLSANGGVRIDARLTLRTDDGELIYMAYQGLRGAPPDIIERLNRNEEVDPSLYYLRIAPMFETGATKYRWLNDFIAVGTGRRVPGGIRYSVHRVL